MYKLIYENIEKEVDTEEKRDKLINAGYTLIKQKEKIEIAEESHKEEKEEDVEELVGEDTKEESKDIKKTNSKK